MMSGPDGLTGKPARAGAGGAGDLHQRKAGAANDARGAGISMPRATVPSVRVEIFADTGHFPRLDEAAPTNAAIERFVTDLG